MAVHWQRVEVKLTLHQALRTERLGQCLWPEEKLDIEEVSRRLLLEHVLWQESERNMVERRCPLETTYKPRRNAICATSSIVRIDDSMHDFSDRLARGVTLEPG